MPSEVDPPDLQLAPCCKAGHADLHVVRDERGTVVIEWRKGADRVVDVRCCLRCGMPLRVVQVAAHE